jgi:hypothetical protein
MNVFQDERNPAMKQEPSIASPSTLTRRALAQWVLVGGGAWLAYTEWAQSQAVVVDGPQALALPSAQALGLELMKALAKNRPLVVMVSLAGCPYCKIARENYLLPMVRQDAISVVQVDMMSKRALLDFQGTSMTHEQMIDKWKVRIAPTLLFFGRAGEEKAERLVGGYLSDFYDAYLQERLQTAKKNL